MNKIKQFIQEYPIVILVILYTIIIVISLVIIILQPYFEAKTFNACTHSNASYFDAMFTELRAFDCKK